MKRYQECNKICKIWRLRWMLLVPFYALKIYFNRTKIFLDFINNDYIVHTNAYKYMSLKECYKISIGQLQMNMHYYYTHEEVMQRINKKYNNTLKNV